MLKRLLKYIKERSGQGHDENGNHIDTKTADVQHVSIAIQTSSPTNSEISTTDHVDTVSTNDTVSNTKTSVGSPCLTASFPSLIVMALILLSVVLGRQYIIDVLIYIDSLDLCESMVLFGVMFTIVAFPIMCGYMLLNIACGYSYGFVCGTLMTAGCALYAMICSHFVIRKFCKNYVERTYIVNAQTKALMDVVSGPNGYKIVFLTRFTPIPFGVQNAIFSVSGIKTVPYLAASALGLLLTQSVYSYLGSTFRSIAQVLASDNSASTWVLLSFQVAMTIGLTVFIVGLAKRELDKNMPGNKKNQLETESRGVQTNDSVNNTGSPNAMKAKSHSRNLSVNIPPIGGYSTVHLV